MKNKQNIYIISRLPNHSMNALERLVKSLSFKVKFVPDNSSMISQLKAGIVIMDCASLVCDSQGFPKTTSCYVEKHKVVIAQVAKGYINEAAAIQRGCKGVLYEELRHDEIIKAIFTIQDSGYWFSRRNIAIALNNFTQFSAQNTREEISAEEQEIIDSLTERELTILGLVCKGATNNEISAALFITSNTVKTHIYSTFRKTQCKNRIELIYWARKYAMSMQLIA